MLSVRVFPQAVLLLATLAPIASAAQAQGEAEAELRAVVSRYMEARNRNDAEAVRRLLTPDADQLVSTGEWRRGLDEFIRGTSAASRKEAGKSSITVETIRLLSPEIALVDGRYRSVSATGAARDMWATLVMKRVGNEWRITAIRNMLPARP
jgi:uncharacterized protein (TIGR02246 family)